MGHYCRICCTMKPNEAFSGGGHRIHVCNKCRRRPIQDRIRIELLDEIRGFLEQSNISAKNLKRLALLSQSDDDEVRELASLVLVIGKAHPGRRRRFRQIKADNHELWQRILQSDLICHWDDLDNADGYPDPEMDEDWDGEADGTEDDELPI